MRLYSVGFYIFAGCILAIFVAEVYWIEYATLHQSKQKGLRKARMTSEEEHQQIEVLEQIQWEIKIVSNGSHNQERSLSTSSPAQKPHIIFILADDLGWADVGYHGSEIRTPVIDKLAYEGIRLESYYTQATCTPTRASILSGRYMSRNGLERVLYLTEAACLPTKYPTMADLLQKTGYKTHLLGKWHLGMSRNECFPNQRGFDSFLGFHAGAQRYFQHTQSMQMHTDPSRQIECYDFWENNNITYKHQGEYSTHVYTQKAEEIIEEHARTEVPMFLFLSHQAVHGPLEVPETYTAQYQNITDKKRKLFAGIATCMDESLGNITKSLKQHGLWNNSVLIFTSDNGGTVVEGGNNTPLKGSKGQYLEGGIRVPGFVISPLIDTNLRGSIFNGLIGASDWFPTLVEGIAAGDSLKHLELDGVNMWESIRSSGISPREEYLFAAGGNCDWDPEGPDDQKQLYGTLRSGDWKLRIGMISQKAFYRIPKTEKERFNLMHQSSVCILNNLKEDPYEIKNLCKKRPDIVNTMRERIREHCRNREAFTPVVERERANPKYHNGLILPWLEDGDGLEWNGNDTDRDAFLTLYVEV